MFGRTPQGRDVAHLFPRCWWEGSNNCNMASSNQSYDVNMPTISLIDIIGASGTVLTTMCWLPQALKIMRALSLYATPAFTLGLVLRLFYGVAIDD